MSKAANTETFTKVVIAKPGETPDEVKIELGGTLEFHNHSTEFPNFEIEFRNCAPPCSDDIRTGSWDKPVFIHMPGEDTVLEYYILYRRGDGSLGARHGANKAHSCGGCHG